MRLAVRSQGSGDRDALLIHGFNCDSGDWWEVAPRLVDAGYRVISVDLRGHGRSARDVDYSLAAYAGDLMETVSRPPSVAIGHSLGACVLAEAARELRPAKSILLDPPWSPIDDATAAELFPDLSAIPLMSDEELRRVLRSDFPRWSDRAIEADIRSWRRWDPATGEAILSTVRNSMPRSRPDSPGLVVVAEDSIVCRPAEQVRALELGYEVRVATGLSHSLFRDDLDGFWRTLDGWV